MKKKFCRCFIPIYRYLCFWILFCFRFIGRRKNKKIKEKEVIIMNKKNIVNKLSHAFASIALKAGIASSNSACRFGYYQNTVPKAMSKFKK